jgi:Mrp family chromosome partitioning ATPase
MNNPPAFPSGYYVPENQGMTLRDYFAARAMQALLSDTDWRLDMDIEDTAKAAYMTADAMLKAREA